MASPLLHPDHQFVTVVDSKLLPHNRVTEVSVGHLPCQYVMLVCASKSCGGEAAVGGPGAVGGLGKVTKQTPHGNLFPKGGGLGVGMEGLAYEHSHAIGFHSVGAVGVPLDVLRRRFGAPSLAPLLFDGPADILYNKGIKRNALSALVLPGDPPGAASEGGDGVAVGDPKASGHTRDSSIQIAEGDESLEELAESRAKDLERKLAHRMANEHSHFGAAGHEEAEDLLEDVGGGRGSDAEIEEGKGKLPATRTTRPEKRNHENLALSTLLPTQPIAQGSEEPVETKRTTSDGSVGSGTDEKKNEPELTEVPCGEGPTFREARNDMARMLQSAEAAAMAEAREAERREQVAARRRAGWNALLMGI